MLLRDARERADRIVEILSPACERIKVAGSIRREKPEVKDIEIVAIPFPAEARDIFGDPIPDAPTPLDAVLAAFELEKNGPKYKRFEFEGLAVDLFLADRRNYGNILAIRTGPWEFGKWMMTRRMYGGAMPNHLRQQGGYLWHNLQRIDCPTEESYFAAIGLPCVPPNERQRGLELTT